jgi:pimeloyl-ACP methyl ester carboxylesterase
MSQPASPTLHPAQATRQVDDALQLVLTGLPPCARARIDAHFVDDAGMTWRSRAVFQADADGIVDVSRSASIDGSYIGVEPRGLYWSAAPCAVEERNAFLASRHTNPKAVGASTWTDPTTPVRIDFEAAVLEGLAQQPRKVASASCTLLRQAEGVRTTVVREGRLRGVLYEPAQVTPTTPLVIALSGSNGGIPTALAAMLASRGVVVFAQAFFAYEDLSAGLVEIPLEMFAEGAHWLAGRHGRHRVGVLGGSRGGELALLLGATFPDRFSAVVAGCPAHVVHAGFSASGQMGVSAWTLNGKPVPYARLDDMDAEASMANMQLAWRSHRPIYLEGWTPEVEAHAGIAVERSRAAILLVSGTNDELWPASLASERVMRRLRTAGYAHPSRHLAYEGAGHWVMRPAGIDFALTDGMVHPVINAWIPLGGSAKANAEASLDSFRKTCGWFHLYATEQIHD